MSSYVDCRESQARPASHSVPGITLFVVIITRVYVIEGFYLPIHYEDGRIVKCLFCPVTEDLPAIFIKLSSWRRNSSSLTPPPPPRPPSLSLSLWSDLLCVINRNAQNARRQFYRYSAERYIARSVTVVKSLATFDNFWSSTRDKFTALSLALFEIQAVRKAVTESNESSDPFPKASQSSFTIISLL